MKVGDIVTAWCAEEDASVQVTGRVLAIDARIDPSSGEPVHSGGFMLLEVGGARMSCHMSAAG